MDMWTVTGTNMWLPREKDNFTAVQTIMGSDEVAAEPAHSAGGEADRKTDTDGSGREKTDTEQIK